MFVVITGEEPPGTAWTVSANTLDGAMSYARSYARGLGHEVTIDLVRADGTVKIAVTQSDGWTFAPPERSETNDV
jgi:uncharacterized protein GlcG (DUF336 family)